MSAPSTPTNGPSAERPYRFLDAYGMDDAPLFFGRDRETRVLMSDVLVNRIVVLFARTGTGKTSLINAGVRPRLERQKFATFFVRVQRDPVEAAAAELRSIAGFSPPPGGGLDVLARAAVAALKKPLVLFFDQFEEFFVYVMARDPERGRAFIADVARLYRDRAAGVHFVFSMREEFFVEMDAFREEIPTIFHADSNLRLRRFDRAQARDAIVRPAAALGVAVEPALVEALLDDLAREVAEETSGREDEIEPAQLQILCDTLWDRRGGAALTLEDYRSLGRGTGGSVARQVLFDRLEEGFRSIETRDQLDTLERLLPELRTEQGTKYVRDVESLVKAVATPRGPDEPGVRSLLGVLDRARFIRRSRRDGLEVVELSHDYLVGYLDELRERVRLIWPALRLDEAMSSGGLATADVLEAVAPAAGAMALPPERAEFLLRSAIGTGHRLETWFRVARDARAAPWTVIDRMLKDEGGSVVQLSHVIDLAERLLQNGDEAAEHEPAFALLERVLPHPALTMEAQEAVAKLVSAGEAAVATRAAALLLGFLHDAVNGGRISSSALVALGRIARPESVALLRRAALRPGLALEAQAALVALCGTAEAALAAEAQDALLDVLEANLPDPRQVLSEALRALGLVESPRSVALLEHALHAPELAHDAKSALDRLAGSSVAGVATAARPTLAAAFVEGTAPAADPYRSVQKVRRGRFRGEELESSVSVLSSYIREGRCVVFLGAGIHAPPPDELADAYPSSVRPPMGTELVTRLAEMSRYETQYPGDSPLRFTRVAEHFEFEFGRSTLVDFLHEQLTEHVEPSPMLRGLARLPIQMFITTNFDGLLERALTEAGRTPLRVAFDGQRFDAPGATLPSPETPVVVKLFGTFERPESLVVTDDDYIRFVTSLLSGHGLPDIVRFFAASSPSLMIGLNLREFTVRLLLWAIFADAGRASRPPSFALDPFPDPLAALRMERDTGGKIITADLWSFIPRLVSAVQAEPETELVFA